jgi:hypothetical protein
MPDALPVTYDGAIFTTQAELCFFHTAVLQPVMARQKTGRTCLLTPSARSGRMGPQ